MPVYVIGHKNPDTDAVCSAIGYADLLRRTGRADAEAARCGELNARTTYVLEKAGVPAPRLVMDVRLTAGQVARREVVGADPSESFLEVFGRMRAHGLRSIPVLDGERRVRGLVSIMKMLDLLLPGNGGDDSGPRLITTTLDRICRGLGGRFQNSVRADGEQEFIITVGAMSARAFERHLRQYPPEKVLLIVGNRPTIQRPAIDYGVRCLLVTGGYELDADLSRAARERGVAVLLAPLDTATTALIAKCSKPVSQALAEDILTFPESALLAEVRERVQHASQMLFPVLDAAGRLAGVFSKSDLVDPPRPRLILVDHNEFTQAVTGVEGADIIEVIDHHRLGGNLTSRDPIRFVNEPVGSTSTIVARMFRERDVTPEPPVALCLAAGIISDTLHLASPTTTGADRDALGWLEGLCAVDFGKFSRELFATGSPLLTQAAGEIVGADCKIYTEGGWKIAVSQVEELALDMFWKRKEELARALGDLRREKNLDFVCLLITDITHHNSLLLTEGDARVSAKIEYPPLGAGLYELRGVVSRKKQLMPQLGYLLGHTSKNPPA